MDSTTFEIVTNKELISVNQDPLGTPMFCVMNIMQNGPVLNIVSVLYYP